MTTPMLVRFYHPELGTRVGLKQGKQVADLTERYQTITSWLRASVGGVDNAIEELTSLATASPTLDSAVFDNHPNSNEPHWLAPIDEQDVWAAGVTYLRSREARREEAIDGGDVYARVYDAERPELFFKSHGRSVVGLFGDVGIRADATWSVPEPELVIVMNPAMEVVGFSAGNDMSSRDIEGENPLYLPQAKFYTASCAIGHGISLRPSSTWIDTTISLSIIRNRETAFESNIHTSQIKRQMDELIQYLGRSNTFPYGVALMTGTGIVPPSEFTLAAGDEIHINIDGIATLHNTVKVV